MDVDKAAKMTMELAHQYESYWSPNGPRELSFQHLLTMQDKWQAPGADFSYGKKCRWLGWMQAAVVQALYPKITMQSMREINIECKGVEVITISKPAYDELISNGPTIDGLSAAGEELVTILKKDYDELIYFETVLAALNHGGVRNWEWFDESLEDHLPNDVKFKGLSG